MVTLLADVVSAALQLKARYNLETLELADQAFRQLIGTAFDTGELPLEGHTSANKPLSEHGAYPFDPLQYAFHKLELAL